MQYSFGHCIDTYLLAEEVIIVKLKYACSSYASSRNWRFSLSNILKYCCKNRYAICCAFVSVKSIFCDFGIFAVSITSNTIGRGNSVSSFQTMQKKFMPYEKIHSLNMYIYIIRYLPDAVASETVSGYRYKVEKEKSVSSMLII